MDNATNNDTMLEAIAYHTHYTFNQLSVIVIVIVIVRVRVSVCFV